MRHCTVERQTIEDGRSFDVVVAFADEGIECGDTVELGGLYIGGGFQPRAGVIAAAIVQTDDEPA